MISQHFSRNANSKTFVFENQITSHSITIDQEVDESVAFIDLTPVILYFCKLTQNKESLVFQLYDPQLNAFIRLNQSRVVEQRFFSSSIVMLKYRQQGYESDTDSQNPSVSSSSRKERNKQRTVREVIQCVKSWREIHNSLDENNNKITLLEAAKIIGISKKSLDDYFCQLRLGEQYEFDFHNNLDSKVGVLRAYVKKHRPKNQKSTKNQKHPKRLKIIQQLSDKITNLKIEEPTEYAKQLKMQQSQVEINQDFNNGDNNYFDFDLNPILKQQNQYENQFYESFDLLVNEPADPFIPYNSYDYRDFKKKQQDFDETDLMLW